VTGVNPTPYTYATSASNGVFLTDCFVASDTSIGLVVLTDDEWFDGGAGSYFPTGTALTPWSSPEDMSCVEDAVAYAVPNTLVTALGVVPGFDAASGFVIGVVLDHHGAPVQGAVIVRSDGMDPGSIAYYPDPSFVEFGRVSTSESGLFLIPGPFPNAAIRPVKDGMTFANNSIVVTANYCTFITLQAEAP
jgi:hypothetical protein